MSIQTAEGMENSEFALSEEELKEIEEQERKEESAEEEENGEVDQAFLDELLKNGDNPDGDDTQTGSGEAQQQQENKEPEGEGQQQDQGNGANTDTNGENNQQQQESQEDDSAYQQHLANEEALNNWQTQLDQAKEDKQATLDELKALGTKLDDGEIGEGEYEAEKERLKDNLREQNKAIEKSEQGLEQAQQTYQAFAEQQQQTANQAWFNELQSFVSSHPSYSPQAQDNRYALRFDEVLTELSEKQALAGLNYKQIIATVQHRVELELGQTQKVEAKQQPTEKKPPKREKVNIPPTMSQMTVAEVNETGDEFALLDRLQGLEYEAALEKLEKQNPEAHKRYMERP